MRLSTTLVTVLAPLFVGVLAFACSSKDGNTTSAPVADAGPTGDEPAEVPVPACDSTRCAPGNECIKVGEETKCRYPCTTQGACGANAQCTFPDGAEKAFCTPNTTKLTAGPGQWGASCKTTGQTDGVTNNPACDTAQGFLCKGDSPTDANAFCTRECTVDLDCAGGYFCANVDRSPNVAAYKREYHNTFSVCLPRQFCAPCKQDGDCKQGADGLPVHCVKDSKGAGLCTSECTTDNNCAPYAKCEAREEASGALVCVPRAGSCIGDGSMCAPCRSDKDCTGEAICAHSTYSHERFCTQKAAVACSAGVKGSDLGCPLADGKSTNYVLGCDDQEIDEIPANHCFGMVSNGTDRETKKPMYVPGCWTKNK